MNKKLKIGDKVYASPIGPESKGTIIEIEERNDKQLVKIKLDKPIKFFYGSSKLFIPVDE